MMEAKVRLSIEVPGAVMLSSQVCEENPKECYNVERITIDVPSKKKYGKPTKETLVVHTRKSRPAKQVISIYKDSYLAMRAIQGEPGTNHPYNYPHKKWAKLSNKDRLELHLKQIAEHIAGEGAKFSYVVLDD